MVLTFTCSLSAAESRTTGNKDHALDSHWLQPCLGIVDAMMFLMTRAGGIRPKNFQAIKRIKRANGEEEIRKSVQELFPHWMADLIYIRSISGI